MRLDRIKAPGWYVGLKGRLGEFKHALAAVIVIGLVLRFAIMALAMVYDSDYWALVVRNINAGEGLYGLDGYFYSPVWGYVLGFINGFQNAFLDIGEAARRVAEVAYFEGGPHQTTATITSLAFNYLTKTPLVMCDLVLAWLSYVLVIDLGRGKRRATYAFALVFLSATVIGSTAVIGMPDTISAVFMMLSIVLVIRGRAFSGGACLMTAVLTKFFPVFVLFTIGGYILAKHKGDRADMTREAGLAIAGAVAVAVILLIPQILEGTVGDCFRFITDRIGFSWGSSIKSMLVGAFRILAYTVVLIVSFLVGKLVYKSSAEDLDINFVKCSLIMVSLCMLFPPATQYLVVVIPLLACYTAIAKPKLVLCWWILSIGAMILLTVSLCTNLLPVAVYTGWIDLSSLTHYYDVWNAGAGPFTLWNMQFIFGSTVQYVGVVAIFVVLFDRRLMGYLTRMVEARKPAGSARSEFLRRVDAVPHAHVVTAFRDMLPRLSAAPQLEHDVLDQPDRVWGKLPEEPEHGLREVLPVPCGDVVVVHLLHRALADVHAEPLLLEIPEGLRAVIEDDAVGHVDAPVAGALESHSDDVLVGLHVGGEAGADVAEGD